MSKEERMIDGFSDMITQDKNLDRQIKLWDLYWTHCSDIGIKAYLEMFRAFCDTL